MDVLNQPIESFRYVGPIYLKRLQKLGIKTLGDLFYHFPFRYDDFSNLKKISEVKIGEEVTIEGKIKKITTRRTPRRKMFLTEALIEDESGTIKAVWFNQPYLTQTLKEETEASFAGKVKEGKNGVFLSSPAYEKINQLATDNLQSKTYNKQPTNLIHTQGLVPVYPETEGLSSRWFRSIIYSLLQQYLSKIEEFLPKKILKDKNFPEIKEALFQIHFPKVKEEADIAKKRFAFEELFLIQLFYQKQKKKLQEQKAPKIIPRIEYIEEFKKNLPFSFTEDQKKTIRDILDDMQKGSPMSRLLEGEVGSGKTVVAALVSFVVAKNGYQVAIMAPTEILAEQHFKEFKKLFKGLKIKIGLLTHNETKIANEEETLLNSEKEIFDKKIKEKEFLEMVKKGEINIVIGTHSLIQERVNFKNLGLVVVDEQHRFGVEQRAKLLRNPKIPNASELSENKKDKIIEKNLSYKLNGIFFEIQRELGRFCREKQYADLFEKKLKENNIKFKREHPIEIADKKSNFADFLIEDKIIVELKIKPFLEKNDYYQIARYLKIKNIELGLLVNFRQTYLKPKRVLNSNFKQSNNFGSFGLNSDFSDRFRFIPHSLSMTATPIPRTLALALYGDLSISQIRQLPKGRKKIITKIVPSKDRQKIYEFLRKEVQKGRQGFIICPLIEESKKLARPAAKSQFGVYLSLVEVKAAEKEFKRLKKGIFPDLKLGLLHGRMKPTEKEKIMKDFKEGKIQILVSTPVVEVGIDVPNATVMLIEGSDRFGLAQLYQFRGRVGRGKHQSYCFLFTESHAKRTWQRLKAIVSAQNAFELAEKDLKIRGPGDFIGTRQAGIPDLAMASLNNASLVKDVKNEVEKILEKDSELKNYPLLQKKLEEFKKKIVFE